MWMKTNHKGGTRVFRFRVWLSNRLSAWSIRVHPRSEAASAIAREHMNKLMMDQLLWGTSIVRIDPSAAYPKDLPPSSHPDSHAVLAAVRKLRSKPKHS